VSEAARSPAADLPARLALIDWQFWPSSGGAASTTFPRSRSLESCNLGAVAPGIAFQVGAVHAPLDLPSNACATISTSAFVAGGVGRIRLSSGARRPPASRDNYGARPDIEQLPGLAPTGAAHVRTVHAFCAAVGFPQDLRSVACPRWRIKHSCCLVHLPGALRQLPRSYRPVAPTRRCAERSLASQRTFAAIRVGAGARMGSTSERGGISNRHRRA
jgi:hypothetical protein